LKAGIFPVRIEVSPKLPFLTWQEFKKNSGISRNFAQKLEQNAKEWGANPDEWRALFFPVGHDHWFFIEVWDGQIWKVKYRPKPKILPYKEG